VKAYIVLQNLNIMLNLFMLLTRIRKLIPLIGLFICGLFNDIVSTSDYIASNRRIISE
jgi:hypothetical protein